MISFFKRLMRDRRGNALMIAGAAMPLLLGSVGLATDTIQWALWKRQLQRAADSAAFAGAYARFQEKSSTDAVNRDLENNNHLWVPLTANYPQVSEPADTSTFVRAVEVTLRVQQPLTFSSMFMSSAPAITVTARAAAIDSGEFCVVALEKTNNSGIIIQGNTQVNLGCGMISNSPSASVSVGVNGNTHNVTADPVAGAGGVPDINGVTNEQSYHLAQPDPYEDMYNTDIPSGMSCTNMSSKIVTTSAADAAAGVTQTLSPGCYTGNNQFKFNGGVTKLNPGVYYLNNTEFNMQGGTIKGDGVTIILTGTDPKQVNLNGGATVQLKAPTSGTWKNMLMIQSPNAPNINNVNNINGSATSSLDGTMYFPNQQVTFSGTTAALTKCAMVVARRVEFAGNANFQNDTTGCVANSKVKGKVIKLIA
jgi:Flp pilus assembly protein TadG